MKRTIAVLLITMLCACGVMTPPEDKTSNKSTDNKSTGNEWVGYTVDELVVTIGEPSNVYMLEGGNRVFEYLNLEKATVNAQSSTRPALSATGRRKALLEPNVLSGEQIAKPSAKPGEEAMLPSGTFAGYRVKRKDSASDQSQRKDSASDQFQGCIVLFRISESDIIESWSVEGKGCN